MSFLCFTRFNTSTLQRFNLFAAASVLLLTSCAGHHFHVIRSGETVTAPHYLELRSEESVATLHFPAGLYSLHAIDDAGMYYRASRKIVQHMTSGPLLRDGGIFVSKRNPRKLRGYVFFAGALTHVGDLSRTQHIFRD
jgi:hypothetical protein